MLEQHKVTLSRTKKQVFGFRCTIQKDAYLSKSIRAFCELFAEEEKEKEKASDAKPLFRWLDGVENGFASVTG